MTVCIAIYRYLSLKSLKSSSGCETDNGIPHVSIPVIKWFLWTMDGELFFIFKRMLTPFSLRKCLQVRTFSKEHRANSPQKLIVFKNREFSNCQKFRQRLRVAPKYYSIIPSGGRRLFPIKLKLWMVHEVMWYWDEYMQWYLQDLCQGIQ
jgi:hypothetical protein